MGWRKKLHQNGLAATHAGMDSAFRRNATLVIGLLAVWMLGTLAAGAMYSPTGARSVGVLLAESIPSAGLMVALGIGLSLVVAMIAARLVNAAVGLFILGGGLFVLAHRTGTVQDLLFGGGSLTVVAIETALWSLALLVMAAFVFRFGGPLRDVEPDENHRHPHPILSREAIIMAIAGALVLPTVWVVAQTPMKGQMLAAVFVGALVSGMAGRLLSPHVQPILIFATPCLFGAVGHVLGIMMVHGAPAEAWVAGRLPAFNLPMPIDYAAGTLLGVSFGLGWAKSFLQHEETQTKPARATAG